MSSQPEFETDFGSSSAAGGGGGAGAPLRRIRSTGTTLSNEDIYELLQRFEDNITLYLSDINLVEPEDTEVKITAKFSKLLLRYTIGRCNPPHEGHIQLFIKNIEDAREAKKADPSVLTKVIFFLGSGPNGGIQTSKDPLDFETKKEVIEYLLRTRGYIPYQTDGSGDYEIRQKDYRDNSQFVTPTLQLSSEVSRLGQEQEFTEIQSQLVVGDKDGDATKLKYMLDSFNKSVNQKFPEITVASEIIAIEPIQSGTVTLSATEIREIAWASKTLEDFNARTNNYYGEKSKKVYDGINKYKPNGESPVVKATAFKVNPRIVSKLSRRGGGSHKRGTMRKRRSHKKRRYKKTHKRKYN